MDELLKLRAFFEHCKRGALRRNIVVPFEFEEFKKEYAKRDEILCCRIDKTRFIILGTTKQVIIHYKQQGTWYYYDKLDDVYHVRRDICAITPNLIHLKDGGCIVMDERLHFLKLESDKSKQLDP